MPSTFSLTCALGKKIVCCLEVFFLSLKWVIAQGFYGPYERYQHCSKHSLVYLNSRQIMLRVCSFFLLWHFLRYRGKKGVGWVIHISTFPLVYWVCRVSKEFPGCSLYPGLFIKLPIRLKAKLGLIQWSVSCAACTLGLSCSSSFCPHTQ